MGWLRLRPAAPIESGVVEPPSEDEEAGQEEEEDEEEDVRSTQDVAAELLRCGDSSLISIWFLRVPVEMFWMLYWLKEQDEGRPEAEEEAAELEEGHAGAEEEEEAAEEAAEEEEEEAWDPAAEMACRKEGA